MTDFTHHPAIAALRSALRELVLELLAAEARKAVLALARAACAEVPS